jgi:hypothetical protein
MPTSADIQNINQKIQSLSSRMSSAETTLNFHTHTGTDLTSKIDSGIMADDGIFPAFRTKQITFDSLTGRLNITDDGDGTSTATVDIGGITIDLLSATSDTQVLFNNAGVFGGSANLTWTISTKTFEIIEVLKITDATSGFSASTDSNSLTANRNYILPDNSGTLALTSDIPAGGGVAGSNTYVQYNNSGAFGASSNFTWDQTNKFLSINGSSSSGLLLVAGIPLISIAATGSVSNDNIMYIATVQTTNNTATQIFPYNLNISGTSIMLDVNVIGKRTGGSAGASGDSAGYVRRAVFKNVAGVVTQVGTTQDSFTVEDQAGWDVSFSISGTTISCDVTGATNNNINWIAYRIHHLSL